MSVSYNDSRAIDGYGELGRAVFWRFVFGFGNDRKQVVPEIQQGASDDVLGSSVVVKMERPTRRLRFYKPEGSDVNSRIDPPAMEPSGPATCVKASRRRWTDSVSAPRSSESGIASQRTSAENGTPVSKGTPETLRTLELNWRDRRRAKLEDITLQRVMGVEEGRDLHQEMTRGVTGRPTTLKSQSLAPQPVELATRPERQQPSRATTEPSLHPGQRIDKVGNESARLKVTVDAPRNRSPRDVPLKDITAAAAATANNTTYQTGAHKARKIVKLVRDARLSVQPTEERTTTAVPLDARVRAADRDASKAQQVPIKTRSALPPKSVPSRQPSSFPSIIQQPPVIAQGSATPRRVSILREACTQQKEDSSKSSSRPSPSFRSMRFSMRNGSNTSILHPISVSPLPAREYPLSSTATLIVYPYEQDLSVTLPSQQQLPEEQSASSRRWPVMSALTASERIDVLDEGNTMRIKSTAKSSAEAKSSRYIRFEERDNWSEADRRRWTLSQLLVDRLKRRTRRATYEFPQGTLHIMCDDPPDIVFYTNIVRLPALHHYRGGKAPDYDPTGDTSALLTASTDMSRICRSRILFSPTRRILKLSTRCGLSNRRRSGEYKSDPANGFASSRHTAATDSFRSRRIIHLPPSSSSSESGTTIDQHLERLYEEQKSLVLQAPSSSRKLPSPDGNQVWQMYELQSLGRFLKLKSTWSGGRS
ncbi:hypothetical protein QFC21_003118 [Naganishia friedmannii]|uniref:Uncharacterized protein n=1 Tax=Naganishia friedmannii TaxID=89922 RepID=A0ACC2VRN4_9TREE|nr:hypothetical protein QFC21_003118 [Naganishia friedmannii]